MVSKEDFKNRDFVSIDDFTKDEIDYLLEESKRFKEEFLRENPKEPSSFRFSLMGRTIAPLFFEDSTRTDQSFQRSIAYLGANMMNFDYQRSSVQKGESTMDTVQIFDSLRPDLIIIRHKSDGFVRAAADNSVTSIINAGDGQNQHPTQTVLDLFSILDIRGKIDGTEIIMAGDNKLGRTVHSLSKALCNYPGCKVHYISPVGFEMPEDLLKELKNRSLEYEVHSLNDLPELLKEVPLVYMTRIQKERFRDIPNGDMVYSTLKKEYGITLDMLEGVNPDFRILHPRPIVFEIDRRINPTAYAYYWEKQPMNGFFTRAPLIKLIVGEGYTLPKI